MGMVAGVDEERKKRAWIEEKGGFFAGEGRGGGMGLNFFFFYFLGHFLLYGISYLVWS